jgi:hypothetical protein
MRKLGMLALLAVLSGGVFGAEEKIRGVLEKTVKPGACAQISDALAEIYYINKTDEAEKLVAPFVGKNEKVVVTGTVEQKEGDPAYYFTLKSVEAYAPKLPPAPAAAPATPATPADTKKDEKPVAPPPAPAPAPASDKK